MTDEGPAPPAVVVNVKVAETPALPATRSDTATVIVTESTALVEPDATNAEAAESELV